MPRRARKSQPTGGRPRSVAAPWVCSNPGEGSACNDQLDLEKLVQELAMAQPAARLLQAAGLERRLAVSQTDGFIAHELRQPLFAIGLAAENLRLLLARDDLDRERMKASVERMAQQVERGQAIIEQTLLRAMHNSRESVRSPSRAEAPDVHAADVSLSIRRALDTLNCAADDRRVLFACQLPDGHLSAALPAVELEQVLVNVIRNAIESIGERQDRGWSGQGRVTITLRRSAGELQCIVADNGVGLAEGSADMIFAPFHTTKAEGGTGLGLHICRDIIERCGGTIEARTIASGGAEFEIRLPSVQDEAARG